MVVIIIGLHRFQLAHQRVKFLNLNTPLPWFCQCVKELTVWPSMLMHNLVVCMLWKKLMLSWILKKTFLLFARDFFLTLSTVYFPSMKGKKDLIPLLFYEIFFIFFVSYSQLGSLRQSQQLFFIKLDHTSNLEQLQ